MKNYSIKLLKSNLAAHQEKRRVYSHIMNHDLKNGYFRKLQLQELEIIADLKDAIKKLTIKSKG